MKKIPFILLLVINFCCFGQKKATSDSIFSVRKILTTKLYQNGDLLSKNEIFREYRISYQATKKYKWGNSMKYAGLPISIGGVALATIALKGEDASATINGEVYDYKIRSLPKLLIGVGLFVAGGCIIESSNELIANSATKYNEVLGKKKEVKKVSYFGLTNDGVSVGVRF